jgi:CRP-like cAMP-binding protein
MSTKHRATSPNRLLAALPARERERFLGDCSSIDLVLGSVLHEDGERICHVYFPTDSSISMLTTVDGHSTLGVGMIGNEGMCGHVPILGGTTAPARALVQGVGTTWRIEIAAFRRHLESLPLLRQLLGRYVNVLIRQLAQTAACTRFHVVEKRLARWLLMTQDRAHADSFVVTQEFLAFMLGVRRAGVTKAAGVLQSAKLIQYSRGKITILNRDRLKASACACYQSDLDIYQRGLCERIKK